MFNKSMAATTEFESLLESQPETGESRLISPVGTLTRKIFITFLAIMILVGILVGVSSLFRVPLIMEPEIYIENFHIPAIDAASNDAEIINTTTITFGLSFENLNPKQPEIFYDVVNMSLYYHGSNFSLPIGNTSIPEFDQGNVWPTVRVETIQTYGLSWEDVRTEILKGNEAVFQVDLHTKYRSSNERWFVKSRRYDLRIGVYVTVSGHGLKSVKQRLKMPRL